MKMNNVKYHKFTGGVPIIFVEKFSDFRAAIGATSEDLEEGADYDDGNYFRTIGFKKSPLKFIVFEDAMMRTLFGTRRNDVVDATLAMYVSEKKYPANPKLAMNYAIKMVIENDAVGAYRILQKHYLNKFRSENPYHQVALQELDFEEETLVEEAPGEIEDGIDNNLQQIYEGVSVSDMKKKIINLINNIEEDVLRKVYSLIGRDNTLYDKAIAKLDSVGIPKKNGKEILNFALETGDFEILAEYLQKRTMTLDDLSKAGNFGTAIKKTLPTISSKFISWLVRYRWTTTPSIGIGEIALITMVKDGHKPKKGDFAVGGNEVEVKGEGARLIGQKGYGRGVEAAKSLEKTFKKHMKKVPKEERIDIPSAGGLDYQVTKKTSSTDKWFNFLIDKGVMTHAQAITAWKEAIKSIYLNMNVSWIDKHIDKNGGIKNLTAWHKDGLAANAKYYHSVEGFTAIVHMNNKGQVRVYKQPDYSKLYDIVIVKSVPSFSSKAGNQGLVYAISVK